MAILLQHHCVETEHREGSDGITERRGLDGYFGFVTPTQRHAGEDTATLAHRAWVYERAKATHPLRWKTRPVRNWEPVRVVYLNPDKTDVLSSKSIGMAA
ncbi:MAG: hypothetical protein H7A12_02365 [Pseudomonadales bacterium]|jgi:hypothetical protein|nr:hypothetical protein [Pseudomonadales bacterium]MCP5337400.1 hypothetical protein [Pseudomonadales bacterium]